MNNNQKKVKKFGLQWHVTNNCDQRCSHCYIWGSSIEKEKIRKELNLKQCYGVVNRFLEFCRDFKVSPIINITGGDPLLFPYIWNLLKYLKENKIPFRILGNPFHLKNKECEMLKMLGCIAYQLSLDGLKETHDLIRQKGSFNETIIAIRRLKKTGIKTVIMSTVSRLNYNDFPFVAKIVTEESVDVYSFARYCPLSRKDINDQLKPEEYRKFLSMMWQSFTELKNRGTIFSLKDNLWILWLYEKGLFKPKKENIVFSGCGCGIKHLTLLPDGTVYACRRFESPVGNVFLQSFQDIFLGMEMSKYRNIDKMEGCNNCCLLNYCRGCHAVSYATSGSFFSKDPQCWI